MPGNAAARDQSEVPAPRARQPLLGDGRSLLDSGLRDFRDVVSEADELGDASARAARAARDSFDAVAAPATADAGRLAAEQTDVVLRPELLAPQFGAGAAEHNDDFEEAPRAPRAPTAA